VTDPDRSTARIFVALAAYREPELSDTIESCLANARHPERLSFGVCHQWDDTIPGAGFGAVDHLAERTDLRLIRYPHTASRGGCWARHVVQGLYDGEDYTLQCDAHSRLAGDWDVDLIDAMASVPSAKPLFTGTPPLYIVEDGIDVVVEPRDDPVPVTVVEYWSEEGWIHHPACPAPPGLEPGARRTRILSGGFVFTFGRWNDEVRQDPEHLYHGEELALTLRSFTSGYDLWNPPTRVIWHRAHPVENPKYVTDDPDGRQEWRHLVAMRRLRALLAGDPDGVLGPYTLGTERTLEEYRIFSGLDCATRDIHPDAASGRSPDPGTLPS
jgi:hypothetical protein